MPASLAVSLANVDRPLRPLLDVAAGWKVDGVVLDTRSQVRPDEFGQTARRQLRHTLSERRLRLAALAVPTRSGLADPDRLDARLGAILSAMQLAYDLGSLAVAVRVGVWPTEDDAAERLGRVIDELATASDRIGPRLTLMPSPGSLRPLSELVAELDAPLAVQLDPAAAVQGGEPLEASARSLAEAITHLRVRDAQRESGETVLGRGKVDWTTAAGLAADLPSLEWFVVDRTEGSQRSVDLETGLTFTRRVFLPPR